MLISNLRILPLKSTIIICALSGVLISNGCDDENSTGSTSEGLNSAEVVIEPENASFEYTDEQDFSAYVISASGDTISEEFDIQWEWYSSNPNVFTVEDNGVAKGKNPGEAFCIVEASTGSAKITAKLRFVGRDSALVSIF